jgi:hypothetical protein
MAYPESKEKYIKLPSGIILTREGVALMGGSKLNIVKVRNYRGIVREGIESESFNAQTLQKMVMNSYIEEISVSLPELLKKRYEIICTNNLIVYAILYKKLSPAVSEMLFRSQVVKDFNRKNPKHAMVDLVQINRKALEQMMRDQKSVFDEMKTELSSEVAKCIGTNTMLSDEDKTLQLRSLDKFIAWIDSRIWYLYYIVSRTNLKGAMLRDFAGMVAVYLKRTQIATHLSNLLMELIQNAERAHFTRIAVKNHLSQAENIDMYLRSADNRKKIYNIAKLKNEMVQIAWNMNPQRNSIGQQYRIHISVTNYGLIDEKTRVTMSKKMSTDVDGISLAEFYGDNGDNSSTLGAGLGLLYNSYLEDYCRSEGIQYHCNIIPEPKYERTTVIVDIAL